MRRKSNDVTTREKIKSANSGTLLTLSCKDLHPDTDEQCWLIRQHALLQRMDNFVLLQEVHSATKGSHSWDDNKVSFFDQYNIISCFRDLLIVDELIS